MLVASINTTIILLSNIYIGYLLPAEELYVIPITTKRSRSRLGGPVAHSVGWGAL